MGSLDTLHEIAIRETTKGCPRGGGAGASQELSPAKSAGVVTAAAQPSAAVARGVLDKREIDMMLDSGSSISLIEESVAASFSTEANTTPSSLKLVSAAGDNIPILGSITLPIQLGTLQANHSLVIVRSLINPVILGLDFLHKHRIIVDFSSNPIKISIPDTSDLNLQDLVPLFDATKKNKAKIYTIEVLKEPTEEAIDDCAVPLFTSLDNVHDVPSCAVPTLSLLLEQYKSLFRMSPGSTTVAEHFIPTSDTPVRVPPRRIPANYHLEVEKQIQTMLKEGIIEESSSPWLAPAVFVRKKTGDIRICVDYRELNKRTVKDAYPLPRPDEVQDRLAGSTIFSTLDLQSGYWQLPVNPSDRAKTAFCPGPGLGLFQFCRMPFGLSGAPASFQHLMDTILRDLPFVTTYLDDELIHSPSIEQHEDHLKVVFDRFQSAGLTLCGGKCNIGVCQVRYLGHVFSVRGIF